MIGPSQLGQYRFLVFGQIIALTLVSLFLELGIEVLQRHLE